MGLSLMQQAAACPNVTTSLVVKVSRWQKRFAGHMAREEADVLPLLEARLCTEQQRNMVWRTLQAMPLRLLERVLPWLAGM